MFSLEDKVVYPGHGVAKIIRITEQVVGGNVASFYELSFLNKNMTILVPTNNTQSIGIRPLSSDKSLDDAFKILARPARAIKSYELTASNWNKRNKEYQHKLRTGSIHDLSEIYRDLKHIATQKELSFGEKNLLHQTEELLVEEISLVQHVEHEKAMQRLRSFFLEPGSTQSHVSM